MVLAHGAWSDGSSWSKVIERLNRQGIDEAMAAVAEVIAEAVRSVFSR